MMTDPLTTPMKFQLATLQSISAGLRMFGAIWEPRPFGPTTPRTDCLYAWATTKGAVLLLAADDFDEDAARNVNNFLRIDPPTSRRTIEQPGRDITRLMNRGMKLELYVGQVTLEDAPDLQWTNDADRPDKAREAALGFVRDLRKGTYETAHTLAIRISDQLGDIGTPLAAHYRDGDPSKWWDFRDAVVALATEHFPDDPSLRP